MARNVDRPDRVFPAAKYTTEKDLTNVDHPINNKSISGKEKGVGIMIGNKTFVATGSEPSDSWMDISRVGAGSGGSGGVATVNNKNPDVSGNVQLAAGDVGAYPQANGDKLEGRLILDDAATYIKASPTSKSTLGVSDKSDGVVIELGSSDNPDHQNVIIRGSRKADPNSGTWLDSLEFGMYGSKPPTVFGVGLLKSNWGEVVTDGFNWIGVPDSQFAGLTMAEGFALVSQKWDEYLTNFRYGKYGTRKLIATWNHQGGDYDVMESVFIPPNANFASGDITRLEVVGDSTSVYAKLDNITQDKYYFMSFRRADVAHMTDDWWREIHNTDVGASAHDGLTQAQADKLYLSLANGGTVTSDIIVRGEVAADTFGMQDGSNGGLNINGDSSRTNLVPVGGNGSEKPLYTLNFNHTDNKWYIGNKPIQIGTTVRSAASDIPDAPADDGDYALRVSAHKKTWERVSGGAGGGAGSHDVHVVGLTEGDADARYLKQSAAFTQAQADKRYLKRSGGVVSGDTAVRGLFTANELIAQTNGRNGLSMGGNYDESGIVPMDTDGNHLPEGLLHYDHNRHIWMVAGKPLVLDETKQAVPSFLAYLEKDTEIYDKASDIRANGHGKVWFGNIVTGVDSTITVDKVAKTYTVKELDNLDPLVSPGTDYLVSLRIGMVGIAPSDGYVRMYLYDEIDGIVADKTGKPFLVEKHFKNGEKLGRLEALGVINVKGSKTLSCHVMDTFTGNIRLTENTVTPSGILIQGLTSEVKTGDGLLQYELDSGETINLRSHYLGNDNFLIDFAHIADVAPTEVPADVGVHIQDGLIINNLAPIMYSVSRGTLNIYDAGEMFDYNVVKAFDTQETYALRGETVTVSATFKERTTALKMALLKWTGKPDEYNRGVFHSREHGNPVLAKGWSIVGSVDVPIVSTQNSTVSKDFVIPDDANNYAIMLYPVQETMQNNLKLDVLSLDVKDHFVSYTLKPTKIAGEEFMRFSELHKRFILDSGNRTFIRYTVGKNTVHLPIGRADLGNADITAVPFNGQPTNGILQFNQAGTATINATVEIFNETASRNEVHLWWEKVEGNTFTKIANSELDSYINAHYNKNSAAYALPEITIPVEKGTQLVLAASTNVADGMYVEAKYHVNNAITTDIKLKGLTSS